MKGVPSRCTGVMNSVMVSSRLGWLDDKVGLSQSRRN
jgi:hypothetical protein